MPPYMSLKFGIDPGTITITPDGIVRYVVVASNRSGGLAHVPTDFTGFGVRYATRLMLDHDLMSKRARRLK